MVTRPKYLHLMGDDKPEVAPVRYKATLMAYGEGGENTFEFMAPPHLLEQPADEIVDAFINYMNTQGMTGTPFRYELNGAVKHGSVLTAMGSLLLKSRAFPFIAMIAAVE
jgi:hypothetical protein